MVDKTTADSPAEFGEDSKAVARYWRAELAASHAREAEWRKRGREIVEIYRSEQVKARSGLASKKAAFNILFSNVETERPALYSATPRPDVRRRYRDSDQLSRWVAEVMERALSYSIDCCDFDRIMESAIDDMLLPGRGACWIAYRPQTGQVQGENGQPVERILWQTVMPEYVAWEDLRYGPCKDIGLAPWVARRLTPDKVELVDMVGAEIAEKVPLNFVKEDGGSIRLSKDDQEVLKRAELWQIWDRRARKVVLLAEGMDEPAMIEGDLLKLKDFVPLPRPLEAVRTTDTIVPVPPFDTYREQADELDAVSKRIIRMVRQIKVAGAYDRQLGDDVKRILTSDDNTLVGLDNWPQFAEGGGFKGALQFLPIAEIVVAVTQLYQNRDQIKQVIFEAIGLADIMRGSTKADETLGAQRIKTAWGGLRIQRRQKQVQRFARDVLRIMAELIAEHCSPEVLAEMTGLDFPMTRAEAEQIKARMAAERAMGAAIPAEIVAFADKPSWEEIMQVMRSDQMRNYRIDVETDSTVAESEAQDMKALRDLLTGIVEFINGIGPVVASGAVPLEAAKAMLLAVVRRAKLGREVEDAVNQIGQPAQSTQSPAPGIGYNGGPALDPAAAQPMPADPLAVSMPPVPGATPQMVM